MQSILEQYETFNCPTCKIHIIHFKQDLPKEWLCWQCIRARNETKIYALIAVKLYPSIIEF